MPVGRRALGGCSALLCGGLADRSSCEVMGNPAARPRIPPDIVMIIDDDQAAEEERFLARTNAEIRGHGVTFDDSLVSFSLCCPSRSTLFTGQYAHDHGVLGRRATAGLRRLRDARQRFRLAPEVGLLHGADRQVADHPGCRSKPRGPPRWNQGYGTIDNAVGGNYSVYGYSPQRERTPRPLRLEPERRRSAQLPDRCLHADRDRFIRRRAPFGRPSSSTWPRTNRTSTGR